MEPGPVPNDLPEPRRVDSSAPTSALPAGPRRGSADDAGASSGNGPGRVLPCEPVGPYRLLREIGRGGMGVVYLGVRDDMPQRHVAVKLVHRGMAAGEILERFQRERAALAALSHPNIARLLDAGTTAGGEPYFVMEYVEGRPIDDYCDSRRLTLAERLRLFRHVCAAVHHAHQNLVVHRDIKPRNILVTADGTPKLLDFGIAKLLNPALGPIRDAPTETGLRVMTPEYASPEQVRGEPITTVSDVYSLGVVLFELLTGRRPYRLRTRLWKELERVICEEAPDRPSTAVSRVQEQTPDGAEAGAAEGAASSVGERAPGGPSARTPELIGLARRERPVRLRRALEGDLDNIVLKALRKEPQRRYLSAEQLAEDIQRHLDGLPVVARPDTFAYRASKFVGRHRAGVLASVVAVAALAGGLAMALRQARIADEQRTVALREAARADVERQVALDALAESERRRQALREAARAVWLEIAPRFAEEGGSVAPRRALAELCRGVYDDLAAAAPPDDLDFRREFADGRRRSGILLRGARGAGASDVDAALGEFAAASAGYAALLALDAEDRAASVGWIESDTFRADLLRSRRRRFDEAQALLEPAAARARALLAAHPEDPAVVDAAAAAIQALGDLRFQQGAVEEARREFGESAQLRRSRLGLDPGAGDPALDRLRRLLCSALIRSALLESRGDRGDAGLEKCLRLLDEAEQLARPMLGRDPSHPQNRRKLAELRGVRGELLRERGRFADAAPALEEAVALVVPLLSDPADSDARQLRAQWSTASGICRTALGEPALAEGALAVAYADAAALRRADPKDAVFLQTFAAAAHALGENRLGQERADALAPLAEAVQAWRELGAGKRDVRPSLAAALAFQGLAEERANELAAARISYLEALPLLTALAEDPKLADDHLRRELVRVQAALAAMK